MERVTVEASKPYDVFIGAGLLGTLGTRLREITASRRALIVTDKNAYAACGGKARESLEGAGFFADTLILESGEEHKSLHTVELIAKRLIENGMGRSDILVALGGGVVCDTAGFAAATYMRGMSIALCPTTLLCAVDASVGGKTAINLPYGKNLLGAFHQPDIVLCDTDVLRALPDEIFREGIAEMIKHGLLRSEGILCALERGNPREKLGELIAENIRVKASFVAKDERDRGERRLLNLGHTYAHALEARSGYSISHGDAVGLGLIWESELARGLGLAGELSQRIRGILRLYGLPYELPPGEGLIEYMKRDKKNSRGEIGFALPLRGGGARYVSLPEERVIEALGSIEV